MRKIIETLILVLILASTFSFHTKAESVTEINKLIEEAKELDGQKVTIEGEAIGEKMQRGNYTWININDTTNAIGIWVESKQAENIRVYGDYKRKGDIVQITGIFNRACIEHDGEADIHCNLIDVVEVGYDMNEQLSSVKIVAATILFFITLFFVMIFIFKIKNTRI